MDQAAPAAVEDRWGACEVREELWDLVEALAEPAASREAKWAPVGEYSVRDIVD